MEKYNINCMKSISILIENLLKLNRCDLKKFYEKNDLYEVLKEYKKDYVNENILIKFIKRSITSKILQYFLVEIIFFIDESSITDKVFKLCLRYPGHFKKTLYIQLGHIWLKEEQLKKLNKVLDTPEAFYKLFLKYANDDNISVVELKQFMLNNKKHLNSLINYKEHFIVKNINSQKEKMIDSLIYK